MANTKLDTKVCRACSDEVWTALRKIAKNDTYIENLLWSAIYVIVNELFFLTNESIIAITNSETKKVCARIKLDGVDNDNFYTVVRRVRDAFANNPVSCKADVWIGNSNLIPEETKSVLWSDESNISEERYLHWNCDEKEEKPGSNAFFLSILVKAAAFLLTNPDKKVKQVRTCFQEDYSKICNSFNDTQREYSKHQSVYSEFLEQVDRNGEAAALVYEDTTFTYEELSSIIGREMQRLQKLGVHRNDVVGIFSDDKVEQIISIMAILSCGAVYLPIEITYPEERIRYMLEDSGAKYVILTPHFQQERKYFDTVQIIEGSKDFAETCDSHLDCRSEFYDNHEFGDDSAYIMYTSGSTGKPKGVEICHKSILRLVKNNGFLEITKEDKVLQTSTIVFDASIIEIYGSLLNGACLVLSNKQDIIDPKRMRAMIQENEITIMWLSSPLFTQLASQDPTMFQGVEHLMVGGDVLSPKHINLVRNCCEGIEIINGYGPTENTTFSTTFSIQEDYENSIPIGRPINNSTAYILNPDHELQPIGALGEICVGGLGVAKGYINNAYLNSQKFIDNPFGEGKLYLTGDNGYWTEDGIIIFAGRSDFQFKVNGFRVEMGEIETEILKCANVVNAVAFVDKFDNQNKIVLVYSGQESESDVKSYLKTHLPAYMFPNYVLQMDIPLNENGKIDRTAIRKRIAELKGDRSVTEHLSEIEQVVSDTVNGLANAEYIKLDDNLFEMSFDSLKMAVLITYLNEIFQSDLLFSEVYLAPTIRKISDLLRDKKSGAARCVQKADYQDKYLASSAQKRIYFASIAEPDSMSYNVPVLFRFHSSVDIEKIKEAWTQIVGRHEALRTRFSIVDGELYQVIDTPYDVRIDESSCSEIDVKEHAASLIRPFDLEKDPLIRINVITTEASVYMLVDIHHIIVDGFSENLIFDEFAKIIRGEAVLDLACQNKDVIYSKALVFDKDSLEKQEQFWLKALSDFQMSDDIFTDYYRDSGKRVGLERSYPIGDSLTVKNVKEYSVNNSSTVFSILLSCMYLTIWKYSDKQKVYAGVPFSGRTLSGMTDVVGMFVNVMPVGMEMIPSDTVDAFIHKVRDIVLASYENQEYQFDSLVEKMNIPREKNRNPFFNFTFNVASSDEKYVLDEQGANWLETVELSYDEVKFDFSVVVIVSEEGICLKIQYDQSLYKEDTIDHFVKCYEDMLHCILLDHEKELCELDVISEADKALIVQEFNNTSVPYGDFNNVVEAFEAAVSRFPEKAALDYHGRVITYKGLSHLAGSRAGFLKKNGVSSGDRVAILVENKVEQILSIFSVLYAGAIYVPIDVDYPESRIKDILANSGAKVLLTDRNINVTFVQGVQVFSTEQTDAFDGEVCDVSTATPDDLAYIMYTSGTTGKPKGVMVNHKAILRLIINTNYVQVDERDNILQTSSVVFDASTFEIWCALFNGMTFYLSDKADLFDLEKLQSIIKQKRISVMWLSAPVFRKFGHKEPTCFNGLTYLLTGGDVVPRDIVAKVKSACEGLKILNGYGPTENTTFSTTYEIGDIDRKEIPIGKSIHNSELFILDEWKHLQPIGAVGEIYVGGAGLAEGYANDPELTSVKFIEVDIAGSSKRLYATGDTGYWLQDGNVVFIGRRDNQVKIRGFRIETDEIVHAALRNELINDAVVMIQENEDKTLVLFCVRNDKAKDQDNRALESLLRTSLKRDLPEFMVPRDIVVLDVMPLNVNGKIDWPELKKCLEEYKKTKPASYMEVRFDTEYEKEICRIWNEILPDEVCDIDTNFFDAGGNSMYLMRIFERLNDTYGNIVSMSELFAFTTIRELAQCIETRLNDDNKPAEMELASDLLLSSDNNQSDDSQFVFYIGKGGYQSFIEKLNRQSGFEMTDFEDLGQTIRKNGAFVLMWAMTLEDVAEASINFTVYENSNDQFMKLTDVLNQKTVSMEDLVPQYTVFMNQVNSVSDNERLSRLDFGNLEGDAKKARILFSIGPVSEMVRKEFLITICLQEQTDRFVFEMYFDHGKCNESVAEELMGNYNAVIDYLIKNF